MNPVWIAFFVGMFVGSLVGILVIAMLHSARRDDDTELISALAEENERLRKALDSRLSAVMTLARAAGPMH